MGKGATIEQISDVIEILIVHSNYIDADKIGSVPFETDAAIYQYLVDENMVYRVFFFYFPDGISSTTINFNNKIEYEWSSEYFYYTLGFEMLFADEGNIVNDKSTLVIVVLGRPILIVNGVLCRKILKKI